MGQREWLEPGRSVLWRNGPDLLLPAIAHHGLGFIWCLQKFLRFLPTELIVIAKAYQRS